MLCNTLKDGSELDQYGAHAYYVWLKTLSLSYLEEVNGYFAAGLGSWLGHYSKLGPHAARLSQIYLSKCLAMYILFLHNIDPHCYPPPAALDQYSSLTVAAT
jgi:hypothetical protein